MAHDPRTLKSHFNYFLVDFLTYCMTLKHENTQVSLLRVTVILTLAHLMQGT